MSEKTAQPLQEITSERLSERSRLLPFAAAVVVCSVISFLLGYGAWYFFGTHNRVRIESAMIADNGQPAADAPERLGNQNADAAAQAPDAETAPPKIAGAVRVTGANVTVGGGATNRPLKNVAVGDFYIAETEVTNSEYAEFVKAAGYAPPADWNGGDFPEGRDNFPVTGVSWNDAVRYCEWLGRKLGRTVRLPSEAEWELAARGPQKNKYPWGNDWNKEAAVSEETGGKISAVKSFPLNRSPFGAFDMAGNVWEWTENKVTDEDALTDEELARLLENGQTLRVVKGGTAKDPARQISSEARYEMPETTKHPHIGFRYVITP